MPVIEVVASTRNGHLKLRLLLQAVPERVVLRMADDGPLLVIFSECTLA